MTHPTPQQSTPTPRPSRPQATGSRRRAFWLEHGYTRVADIHAHDQACYVRGGDLQRALGPTGSAVYAALVRLRGEHGLSWASPTLVAERAGFYRPSSELHPESGTARELNAAKERVKRAYAKLTALGLIDASCNRWVLTQHNHYCYARMVRGNPSNRLGATWALPRQTADAVRAFQETRGGARVGAGRKAGSPNKPRAQVAPVVPLPLAPPPATKPRRPRQTSPRPPIAALTSPPPTPCPTEAPMPSNATPAPAPAEVLTQLTGVVEVDEGFVIGGNAPPPHLSVASFDRWLYDLQLAGVVPAPARRSLTSVAAPPPPALVAGETAANLRIVWQAYRGAVKAHYGRHASGPPAFERWRASPSAKSAGSAIAYMLEHDISPARWAVWSMPQWDAARKDDSLPGFWHTFSIARLRKHLKWYRSTADLATVQTVTPPLALYHWDALVRLRGLLRAAFADGDGDADPETIARCVATAFDEGVPSAAELEAQALSAAATMQTALDRGVWLWS